MRIRRRGLLNLGIGCRRRRRYRWRGCGMADKVHLLQSVLGPEVNVEDVHCMLYLAVGQICTWSAAARVSGLGPRRWSTHLQSISFPVFASLTMSLTQGGGVMGRRSYPAVSPQSRPTTRNLQPRKTSVPCHRSHTSAHVAAVAQHPGCRSSD